MLHILQTDDCQGHAIWLFCLFHRFFFQTSFSWAAIKTNIYFDSVGFFQLMFGLVTYRKCVHWGDPYRNFSSEECQMPSHFSWFFSEILYLKVFWEWEMLRTENILRKKKFCLYISFPISHTMSFCEWLACQTLMLFVYLNPFSWYFIYFERHLWQCEGFFFWESVLLDWKKKSLLFLRGYFTTEF